MDVGKEIFIRTLLLNQAKLIETTFDLSCSDSALFDNHRSCSKCAEKVALASLSEMT
jgi:hypothetical protein